MYLKPLHIFWGYVDRWPMACNSLVAFRALGRRWRTLNTNTHPWRHWPWQTSLSSATPTTPLIAIPTPLVSGSDRKPWRRRNLGSRSRTTHLSPSYPCWEWGPGPSGDANPVSSHGRTTPRRPATSWRARWRCTQMATTMSLLSSVLAIWLSSPRVWAAPGKLQKLWTSTTILSNIFH